MNSSNLVQTHHLSRKAVIYIRQSTPNQIIEHTESLKLQRMMKQHALKLGWKEEFIQIIESDLGYSATTIQGRDGYKTLLSEVALGHIGIILSYESTRLSRNCTDWYPLLDLCTFNQCLIADRDGVYDPSTPNGRLLLGMKGIFSEIELHTIRGRLLAGIQNKAKRGELALALPTGLTRLEEGIVIQDPDLQVKHSIELVFSTFLQLRSTFKVLKHFRDNKIRLPRRYRNKEIIWKAPTIASITSILRNPAYAGTFVYGRTRTERKPGSCRPKQRLLKKDDWKIIVHDRYPAYISWETFEKIGTILDDNYAEYKKKHSRGTPRQGSALLQGLIYCGICGHKMHVQYKGGNQYLCNALWVQAGFPVCQRMSADPVDRQVIEAFFQALCPAELDLYEQAIEIRASQKNDIKKAHQLELTRLEYEANLTRRRYQKVDPDNRLVAYELERQWEKSLQELQTAKEYFQRIQEVSDKIIPIKIPAELRATFESIGQSLPDLWGKETLSRPQRKALLRCLIEKVILDRSQRDCIQTKVVWRGGAYSEFKISTAVNATNALHNIQELEKQILHLEALGKSDKEISEQLTQLGFRSPMEPTKLLENTVKIIRLKHCRVHRYHGPRPRRVKGYLTIPQLSKTLSFKPHWLYHKIKRNIVQIEKDSKTGLYLFPDSPKTLEDFRKLQKGTIQTLSY